MFERRRASRYEAAVSRSFGFLVVPIVGLLLAAGCGTVAVNVDQPVGTRVELCEKAKWFGSLGPDWGTEWDRVFVKTVGADEPAQMELEATGSWLEGVLTWFPRQYRVCFDLSKMATFPGTSSQLVEVWRVQEVLPQKHQHIVDLWHRGKTLDVLVNLPPDVLADVLYNLGDNFRRLLKEVPQARQEEAARKLKTWMDSSQEPSPAEIESWLKGFLTREQLGQVCRWVQKGITLTDVRWVRLGGEPKHKDVPFFWRALKSLLETFVRQPQIRSARVDFYQDVILRDLLVRKVEAKLVHLPTLKLYAEVKTFDTTYFTDRVVPALDLVQGEAKALDVVVPKAEDADMLLRQGVQSVRLDEENRAEAARLGLPITGLPSMKVTSIHSQVLGAVLSGNLAYVIIWNNPGVADPSRFLTTVVTVDPYGMASVWAMRDNQIVGQTRCLFRPSDAPVGAMVSLVADLLDQRGMFVKLDKPVAVFAFGNRTIEPWTAKPKPEVSRVELMKELRQTESGN